MQKQILKPTLTLTMPLSGRNADSVSNKFQNQEARNEQYFIHWKKIASWRKMKNYRQRLEKKEATLDTGKSATHYRKQYPNISRYKQYEKTE